MSNPYTGTGMASIGERFWRFLWLLRLLCQDISVSLSLSLDEFMISSVNLLTISSFFFFFFFLVVGCSDLNQPPNAWMKLSRLGFITGECEKKEKKEKNKKK